MDHKLVKFYRSISSDMILTCTKILVMIIELFRR